MDEITKLKMTLSALRPWCGKHDLEGRVADKLLEGFTFPDGDFETLMYSILKEEDLE